MKWFQGNIEALWSVLGSIMPHKNNYTPIKPSRNSTMMCEEEFNCFLYPTWECQVMVANGVTIKLSEKFHNKKIIMGEYALNIPMLSIPIGDVDVVLGVKWLQFLWKPWKIIRSNGMKNILKK